jgi:ketosteroid isomerase-like protein
VKDMNENENVQVVKQFFDAAGKGDLDTILNLIAEKVDWQAPVTRTERDEIPFAKPRNSREEVAQYFKDLFGTVKFEKLDLFSFTAQDDRVFVEGYNRGVVLSDGRPYEHDWVMQFTIHDGKIVRHRHYYDTNDLLIAFRKK